MMILTNVSIVIGSHKDYLIRMETIMTENTAAILTPYAASKVANVQLLEAGAIEKALPPQMFYNYTSARVNKGKTPFIKFNAVDGVDREDLQRWINARIEKAGKKVADPEQAEFDAAEAN